MSPTGTEDSPDSTPDQLGPFSTLLSDEDRERKAEATSAGTYNVIVNPSSFAHLPEYNDEFEKRTVLSIRRGSLAASLASSAGKDSVAPLPSDPNIIVLKQFEDSSRRPGREPRLSESPTMSKIKIEDESPPKSEAEPSLMHSAVNGGPDFRYLQQFRHVVWKQIVQAEIEGTHGGALAHSGVDVLEHHATYFTPLFHAMMATAALSLAQHDGKERVGALQHYDQATSALQTIQSAEALSSDGAFLTHFLLLIYEIAAAEAGHQNMWLHHLSTLFQISKLRREIYNGERYPFVTWWICNIDLYALFSGAGTGDFVGSMLHDEMIPPPGFHLYPLGPDGSSVVYADEVNTLPHILQLNYEVTLLAVRLALLAQELRQEAVLATDNIPLHKRHYDAKLRLSRVHDLQGSLRGLWIAEPVVLIGQQVGSLPPRSRKLYEHAFMLYKACLVYSHTSMWPSQMVDTGPENDAEICLCVLEILSTARSILDSGRLDTRCVIFPLFLAGYAGQDGNQKMQAMNLIQRMEKRSIGANTTAARRALGIVYERQTQHFMVSGQDRDVCWIEVMVEHGLHIVNFGL